MAPISQLIPSNLFSSPTPHPSFFKSALINWGSSSMLVLRRKVPIMGIMRGSFLILKTGQPVIKCFYPKQPWDEMGNG